MLRPDGTVLVICQASLKLNRRREINSKHGRAAPSIGDDMGLGITRQAIVAMQIQRRSNPRIKWGICSVFDHGTASGN
jgi:hypothetical protein